MKKLLKEIKALSNRIALLESRIATLEQMKSIQIAPYIPNVGPQTTPPYPNWPGSTGPWTPPQYPYTACSSSSNTSGLGGSLHLI
jgi:hypothetical protein